MERAIYPWFCMFSGIFCWFYEAYHVSLIHAIYTVLVEVLRRYACLQTSIQGMQGCICTMCFTIVFESAILSSYF